MPLPAPKGVMTFTGIEQVERGSFVLTQGITPSVATLEIEPQDASEIPLNGKLVIAFGQVEIVFNDCRVDRASFDYGPDGLVWRLNILDRRWKFRFAGKDGPVSGWFNQRFNSIQPAPTKDDAIGTYQLGSINPNSILSPQDLSSMLLDAMGEENYDVSQLPNNSLPEVVWDMDNPAQLLQDLCDKLGCRICLNLDDTVSIAQTGLGADMPTEAIEQLSQVVDPPEIPESILVVGGRTRYQIDVPLVPVGLDVDGTIKEIWNLSYAPTQFLNGAQPSIANVGGWGYILNPDPEIGFWEIAGWETPDVVPPLTPENIAAAWQIGGLSPQVNPRYLARQTVWRWYRIATNTRQNNYVKPVELPPRVPGWRDNQRIEALWQILPIDDKLVLGWYDNINQFRPRDALVYGRYWSPSWDGIGTGLQVNQDADNNFTTNVPLGVNYTIDREKGIVMFDEPILLFKSTQNLFWPADIYLVCTVSPRDATTQAADHFTYSLNLDNGTPGTGPRVLKRDELIRCVVSSYDTDGNITTTFDNAEALQTEAAYAIEAALLEYQTLTPADGTFMGIIAFGCDGAITQVGWSVGPEGATTRIARNTEIHFAVPSYRERVLMGSLARTTQTTLTLQQQARKE